MTAKLLVELREAGIKILRRNEFTADIIEQLEHKFNLEIFPVLTPMAVDFSRRFPLISNKNLYIGVKLLIGIDPKLALVQVPSMLDRLIKVEDSHSKVSYSLRTSLRRLSTNCF